MITEEEVRKKLEIAHKHSLDLFVLKAQTISTTEERQIWSARDYVNGYVEALKQVLEEEEK